MHILIVEDETEMAALLKRGLEEENHTVRIAHNGYDGLEIVLTVECDALVLDLMLPGIGGFEIMRRLRKARNRTPILVLTALDKVQEIVKSLDLGADDYMTKPFSFDEFLARLRAVSRRSPGYRFPVLRVVDLTLDPTCHMVKRAGNRIDLSRTEFRLLELLMRKEGQVVSRSAIVRSVWDSDGGVEDNTIDSFMSMLRSKVDRDYQLKLIETVRGIGYVMRASDLSNTRGRN